MGVSCVNARGISKRAGDGFVGGGGGVAFAWSQARAAFVEVAALESCPFAAFVLAPTAGIMIGFP